MNPRPNTHLHLWLQDTLLVPCELYPLTGGSSNTLYQVICGQQRYVLRVNAPNTVAFSVNRACEAKVLELIQPYPWAVQTIRNDVAQGLCLMQAYAPLQVLNQHHLAPVLNAIHSLQSIVIPEPDLSTLTINYSNLTAQYYQHWQEFPDTNAAQLLNHWQQGLSTLPAIPQVLVHHDLHLGNLCRSTLAPHSLILIDWEYAGLGNAWFDAVALVRLGLSTQALQTLPAFQALTAQQWEDGLQIATRLTQVLTDLWYWARGHAEHE